MATIFFAIAYFVVAFTDSGLNLILTELTAGLTFESLKMYEADKFYLISYTASVGHEKYLIWSVYNQHYRVNISDGCNGMAIILLFNWFLYSQDVIWKRTILFSLFGSLGLILLNVIRLNFLFYLSRSSTFWFDFMHKGVFQIGMYVVMATLWYLFLKEKKAR